MESGVRGETGLNVQRRVMEEQGHDIEPVIIRHLLMAVLLAQDCIMKLNKIPKISASLINGIQRHIQQYFRHFVTISFIGGVLGENDQPVAGH
jgi:hypothetical protein